VTEKESLRIDILCGYKYTPQYFTRFIGPTEQEWAAVMERQKKKKRKEDFMDFLSILFLIFGWIFCIAAGAAMMYSFWGCLFFIPAGACALGLKELSKYI